ncbi:hypothetical protein SPRG_14287 [Saprolegnia parasitica CBS 223.65]|uniref:Uncharacterized protein n=1 Tax=Saprolegnia parasitica (strain CBS 223.65) TaxID=695850 RepID=A0A067BQI5_SAPPC|nr:hypothetical protein SPRG_14287 [Saprolegnia parasitica CBS 223.65]KDO20528.1 hypothetical protein SPRG_14287 [Saprolegnia parasitica CBS 223.65]|eukprot:XP_012208789.1 hypothetical protein SPRG_14287 [Saprolegnia parasitica CBS 223.65]
MAIVLGPVAISVALHLLPRRVANMAALTLWMIVLCVCWSKKEDEDGYSPATTSDDTDDIYDDIAVATSGDTDDVPTYGACVLIVLTDTVTALLICNFVVEDVIPAYLNHLNAAAQVLSRLGFAPAPLDVTDDNDVFNDE